MNKQEYIRHLAVRSGIDDVLVPKDALEKFADSIAKDAIAVVSQRILGDKSPWDAEVRRCAADLAKFFEIKK